MKTIKTVIVTPVFCEDDIPPLPSTYEEATVYFSEKHSRIALKCLCGCGDLIILPVNQSPQGWQLTVDAEKRITLIGSIQQMQGCRSHYIITKNKANFT